MDVCGHTQNIYLFTVIKMLYLNANSSIVIFDVIYDAAGSSEGT